MGKQAGIFLPLFSVPGNQGIGDLGQKTIMMIDAIANAGYGIWSLLPLSPSINNGPFEAVSSFAGDPIYINIDRLAEMGLLTQSSIVNCNKFKDFVDYDTVRAFKEPYLQRAFKAFRKNYAKHKQEFEAFKKEAFWLNAWTAYEVFRMDHEGRGWTSWEEEFRNWPEKQEVPLRDYVEKIFYVQFLQFIFYKQLQDVVDHARSRDLKLMMPVPFFQMTDSVDVWSSKKNYKVRSDGHVVEYAGLPPEAGNEGKIWESPVYNMDAFEKGQFKNFRDRIRWQARYFDMIELENFKAFDAYWRIPENRDIRKGQWSEGPSRKLMSLIAGDNPSTEFIAEDAGMFRPSLKELENEFGIPGMDVLQRRMETKLLKRPPEPGCVVYTSTYETPSVEEDYTTFTNNKRIALRRFFKKRSYDHRAFHDLVCHYALDSDAGIVILNMADVLGLKEKSYFRHTGPDAADAWSWKIKDFKTFPSELLKTTPWLESSGRLHKKVH